MYFTVIRFKSLHATFTLLLVSLLLVNMFVEGKYLNQPVRQPSNKAAKTSVNQPHTNNWIICKKICQINKKSVKSTTHSEVSGQMGNKAVKYQPIITLVHLPFNIMIMIIIIIIIIVIILFNFIIRINYYFIIRIIIIIFILLLLNYLFLLLLLIIYYYYNCNNYYLFLYYD